MRNKTIKYYTAVTTAIAAGMTSVAADLALTNHDALQIGIAAVVIGGIAGLTCLSVLDPGEPKRKHPYRVPPKVGFQEGERYVRKNAC